MTSALMLALQLSTGAAQLGVPVQARTQAPLGLQPDLERSTTDTYSVSVARRDDSGESSVWTLNIIPLAVGKIPIHVYWEGGASDARSSAELLVAEPSLAPDAQLADIKRPMGARPAIWPWLAALAAAVAGYWWWRKRRLLPIEAQNPGEVLAPALAPDEQALAALAALGSSPLWEQRRYKEYYAALTDILRAYLENRFAFPALKLTTSELAKRLRLLESDRTTVALVREVFDRADLVKFAKTVPSAEQGGLDLDAARRIIQATAPAVAAESPAP